MATVAASAAAVRLAAWQCHLLAALNRRGARGHRDVPGVTEQRVTESDVPARARALRECHRDSGALLISWGIVFS